MKFILGFLLIHLVVSAGITPALAGTSIKLDVPPASLEKWYKPANKRQVWLHTMFRLRREMQAIGEYAEQNNPAGMEKWISRLETDYNKIADMVPEWQDDIKPRLLKELAMFAEKGDTPRVGKTLKMIQRSCDDCHDTYRPLVSAMYRSPRYDDIRVKDRDGVAHSFNENMDQLSESVNRILIALDDGHKAVALQASRDLAGQLRSLGDSCNGCHKDDDYPQERILGVSTRQRLERLQTAVGAGRVKDGRKLMGEIAVTVCARCHNTHRIVHDLRNALLPGD